MASDYIGQQIRRCNRNLIIIGLSVLVIPASAYFMAGLGKRVCCNCGSMKQSLGWSGRRGSTRIRLLMPFLPPLMP